MIRVSLKFVGCAWAVGLRFVRSEDGEEVLSMGVPLQPRTREPCAPEGYLSYSYD